MDLLRRYADGERSFREMDVQHPDALALDNATLAEVDFSGSFLLGNFRRANLRGSSFRNANVKTCDFSDADLTGADFRGAALEATTFKGAIMTGKFRRCEPVGSHYERGRSTRLVMAASHPLSVMPAPIARPRKLPAVNDPISVIAASKAGL